MCRWNSPFPDSPLLLLEITPLVIENRKIKILKLKSEIESKSLKLKIKFIHFFFFSSFSLFFSIPTSSHWFMEAGSCVNGRGRMADNSPTMHTKWERRKRRRTLQCAQPRGEMWMDWGYCGRGGGVRDEKGQECTRF